MEVVFGLNSFFTLTKSAATLDWLDCFVGGNKALAKLAVKKLSMFSYVEFCGGLSLLAGEALLFRQIKDTRR